ncbi:MAG: hypothetical protein D6709_02390 [Chloroflexi bacterium]|nr:MAG: hypothetical protein D6709_02390 [Chloroflexota bacterium]
MAIIKRRVAIRRNVGEITTKGQSTFAEEAAETLYAFPMTPDDPTPARPAAVHQSDQLFREEVLALRSEVMAHAVQWPLAALGIAGLLLSLLADTRVNSLMHIVPYELAIAAAIIGLWQSHHRPRLALMIVGWGAWGVALSFSLIHAIGAAMIGIRVACAAGIILIGSWAGWAMWAGAVVILAAHGALAASPYPTPAQLAAVTIGAGLARNSLCRASHSPD